MNPFDRKGAGLSAPGQFRLSSGTPAYLALPDAPARRGIVLAPDLLGLRPVFFELAERLATDQGWAVCAYETFPGQEDLDIPTRQLALAELDDDAKMADIRASCDVLAPLTDRLGMIGFCCGGMYTLKASVAGLFDRAVAFYGPVRLMPHWQGLGQKEPLDWLAAPPTTDLLAIFAGNDPYIPAEDVDALRRAVPGAEIVTYPGAGHAFAHDPTVDAYRPDDADDAWRRTYEFLR